MIIEKLWGSEEILINNELYCAKYLNLKKGFMSSLHYHKIKDETFYVLEGEVRLQYENGVMDLRKGKKMRIKPGIKHRFQALTDTAKILEVSTHHSDDDSYRLEESREI